MSQPQKEVMTVSAFLQSVQEARVNQPPCTALLYEHLKIVNDDQDSGSAQQPPDFRGLSFYRVDFSNLKAPKALCAGSTAFSCDFWGSDWSEAQGGLQIYGSHVSHANFAGAEGFFFCNAYIINSLHPKGLTDEQAQSITSVSNKTKDLLDTCDTKQFNHIIDQERRFSELKATVAALAAQVDQLTRQRQQ